jgi:hypothetical protein
LQCLYNKTHKRGKPLPPGPGIPAVGHSPRTASSDEHVQLLASNPACPELPAGPAESIDVARDLAASSRSSLEVDGTRFEGDYIGPTSGIAFLQRAQKRFHQDYVASISRNAESQSSKRESVYAFGDGWMPDYSKALYSLPERALAKKLLDRYFDFAMPTYRFLHRPTVEAWLHNMYEREPQARATSNAKKAIVNLILATAKLYHESAMDLHSAEQSKQAEEM